MGVYYKKNPTRSSITRQPHPEKGNHTMHTVLAADAGNTTVTVTCFRDGSALFTGRIDTDREEGEDTYLTGMRALLRANGIRADEIDGSVLSSVVPEITQALSQALSDMTGKNPLVVSSALDTGITVSPAYGGTLGNDRLTDCAAALHLYGGPVAVFDLGSCTTVSVADENGVFVGGMITAGIQMSLTACHEHTSQLPLLTADLPAHVIGRNTASCMQSGAVIGAAAMIDGFCERIEQELCTDSLRTVLTGGLGKLVIPFCRTEVAFEPDLLVKGLLYIYERNRGISD